MPSQPNVSKAALSILTAAGLLVGCETGPKPKVDPLRSTPEPTPAMPNNQMPPTSQQSFVPHRPVDPVIASIGSTRITRSELEKPLMEGYGFNTLMLIVQRNMARDACNEQKLVVTPEDLRKEFDAALQTIFQAAPADEDREKLLEQYLAQPKPRDQMFTRPELDIVIETNAYMRKLVAKKTNEAVTDEMLQQQFNETYGAQVQVRSIAVDNPQDAARVRARLDAGEDFATVARQMSRDPSTARLGGERAPFGLGSVGYPENFKRVAFNLKVGEVSDPVSAGGGYHLIKLERKIAPKAVKFDDVKGSLREDVEAKATVLAVKDLRDKLARLALAQMQITEPTLKAEFDKRLKARDTTIRDRAKMQEQMEKDRARANTPATKPATAPVATPAGPAQPAEVPPPPPKPATTTPTATEPVAPPADTAGPATKPAPTPPAVPPAIPSAPNPPPTSGKSPAVPKDPTTAAAEGEKKAAAPQPMTIDPTTGAMIPVGTKLPNGTTATGVIQNRSGVAQPAAASRPATQP